MKSLWRLLCWMFGPAKRDPDYDLESDVW